MLLLLFKKMPEVNAGIGQKQIQGQQDLKALQPQGDTKPSPAAMKMSAFPNFELWRSHNSFEKAFTVFLLNNRETKHNALLCLHKMFLILCGQAVRLFFSSIPLFLGIAVADYF